MSTELLLACVEWAGSLVGLLGALLLALHKPVSRWGWVAFLASNILLIVLAAGIGRWGLFFMQVGYLVTSLLGIWRTFGGRAPAPQSEAASRASCQTSCQTGCSPLHAR